MSPKESLQRSLESGLSINSSEYGSLRWRQLVEVGTNLALGLVIAAGGVLLFDHPLAKVAAVGVGLLWGVVATKSLLHHQP